MDKQTKGFSGGGLLVLVLFFLFVFVVLAGVGGYLFYEQVVVGDSLGLVDHPEDFVAPEEDGLGTNKNIVQASGFIPLNIDLAHTNLHSNGDFQASFVNAQDVPIMLGEIRLSDKITGKACELSSTKGKDIPARGYYTLIGINCQTGYPGDEYALNMRMEYQTNIEGVKSSKEMRGILRGYFV